MIATHTNENTKVLTSITSFGLTISSFSSIELGFMNEKNSF